LVDNYYPPLVGPDRLLQLVRRVGRGLATPEGTGFFDSRADIVRNFGALAGYYLLGGGRPIILHAEGLKFYVRPWTDDLLAGSSHEQELKKYYSFMRRSVFLDCGSHTGHYALRAARAGMIVHAWEPNWDACSILKTNLVLNHLPAFVHPEALGDFEGMTTISDTSRTSRIGVGKRPVAIRTLDSYDFDRVDLLKIDTEGYEEKVIRGGLRMIRRCKPKLVVETHDFVGDENIPDKNAISCRSILEGMGYDVTAVSHGWQTYLIAEHPKKQGC